MLAQGKWHGRRFATIAERAGAAALAISAGCKGAMVLVGSGRAGLRNRGKIMSPIYRIAEDETIIRTIEAKSLQACAAKIMAGEQKGKPRKLSDAAREKKRDVLAKLRERRWKD